MIPERRARLGTDLLLLAMAAIWAVNFSVVKVALEAIDPLGFNAMRYALAAAVVYAVLRREGPIPRPAREDLRRIVVLGLIGNVLYQVLFIHGMDRTRAGNASLLLASAPVWTALLAIPLAGERHGRIVWLGIVATVVGITLVVLGGPGGLGVGRETLAGDAMLMGAAIAWALYTVLALRPIARYGSVAVTAWTLWIGTALLVVLGIPDLIGQDWRLVDAGMIAAVVYSGVFAIAVAYLIWYHGVRRIGSTRTATFSNVVPAIALLVAWLWLGEVPAPLQLVGAVTVIGGVSLARGG